MKTVHIMKKAWQMALMVSVLTFVFMSCNDAERTKAVYDPNKPVVLTSFEPTTGRIREMVLLDGDNFGADTTIIKVFFNEREAKVIGSTGKRILVAVPRLPGDTCILTVAIGDQRKSYNGKFYYKKEASVTTIAGNGIRDPRIFDQGLDKAQMQPMYIGADLDGNIFLGDQSNVLLRINEEGNLMQIIATGDQGFIHRCQVIVNPSTNVLQMGAEGQNNRDRFAFFDPNKGWALNNKFIKEWNDNGYTRPVHSGWISNPVNGAASGAPNSFETHYHCLYCPVDGMYYTRYNSGAIVRIDPVTWKAKIIGMTPMGIAYGVAMHPIHQSEMWIGYDGVADANTGIYAHSICKVDVLDETVGLETTLVGNAKILASFQKLSAPSYIPGHRDGPLYQALFFNIRGISFDADGNLFVSEHGNSDVRMINTMINPMSVETIIGIPGVAGFKDGPKETALFSGNHGLVTDKEGNIYVSDYNNNRIRKIAIE